MTLYDLKIGESAIIAHLMSSELMVKLVEIGIRVNTRVTLDAVSWSRDPICVIVGNSKIMLRKNEAKSILVRPCDIDV